MKRRLGEIAAASLVLVLAAGVTRRAQAQTVTYTVLHSFTGSPDGAFPLAALLLDKTGNLYGTTATGGSGTSSTCAGLPGCGTVFKLDPSGNETVLHRFAGAPDGLRPLEALITDKAGNLYSTTAFGGLSGSPTFTGVGTVFKLDPSGNETLLHSFTFTGGDGTYPSAGLVMDAAGNLYGTTRTGGSGTCSGGCGTVFKLDTSGNETVLYSFKGGSDGATPEATLVMDAAGNLYGTTNGGGASGNGTVFKLGTSGNEMVLHSFTDPPGDSGNPEAALIMDAAGNLYGTTEFGGTGVCSSVAPLGCGTVFKLDPSGNETVLHSFTNSGGDGALPTAGVVMDAAGNLYGATKAGGSGCGGGCGTVFKLDASGNETVLYSFTGGSDGGGPRATLILDTADNLYGTTSFGGATGNGTVFKLTVPVPMITSISPTSATAGGAAFTLTVNGTNFITSSTVNFNGNARTTTFVSATQLAAAILASDIATAGIFNVIVNNPVLGGGNSNAVSFTVNNPVPTITSISPTSATAGGAAFTLTVNGTGFVSTSVVNFGRNARANTSFSATQLTAVILASDIATADTLNVTVTNPAPGGGTSNAVTFTVNNPVPTITTISPSSATAGGAAFTLTVNGTGFVPASVVNYGGNVRATTQVSSTQLTATISASDIATAGNFNVTVFNPPPGGGTSNAVNFTVTDFSIAVASGGSATATITAGQTASYNLQVSPSNGFTGTVNLTCSGAPSLATCTPAPSNPAVSGTPTPFTVSVSTMAPSIAGFLGKGPASALLSGSIGVLLGVVMLMVLTRTTLGMRRPQRALAPVLALIALALLSGCGGGSPNPTPTPMGGTPKGTYTLTVTGSSGGTNRTISLTLTVN